MRIKMKNVGIFVLMTMVFLPNGFAETIYLNDGSSVNEKITERGEGFIVTFDGSMYNKYYEGQYVRIEEDLPVEAPEEVLPGDTSGEKDRLIVDFIAACGVRSAMAENMEQVIAGAPETERQKLRELLNVDDIIGQLVPIYSKYYTTKDLRELIVFYNSSLGQRVLEVTPMIMQETVEVSVNYLQKKLSP